MAPYAPMPKEIDVNFRLQGQIREDRQTRCFVSLCPALDLYSAGRTRIDAKKALSAAVLMYVRICYERGILGRIMKDMGFIPTQAAVTEAAGKAQFIAVTE